MGERLGLAVALVVGCRGDVPYRGGQSSSSLFCDSDRGWMWRCGCQRGGVLPRALLLGDIHLLTVPLCGREWAAHSLGSLPVRALMHRESLPRTSV